jgi:calcineurin-like phosphoesterase family protein
MLGDACMGDLYSTLPILQRIHAPIIFVAGNHDRCHPYNGQAKSEEWGDKYADLAGLASLHVGNVDLVLTNGSCVQVSHFPYSVEQKREGQPTDKFSRWRPVDDGRWLLHGHTHGAWRQKGQQIDVGIDAWGGYPVSEETLLTLMSEKNELAALPWER